MAMAVDRRGAKEAVAVVVGQITQISDKGRHFSSLKRTIVGHLWTLASRVRRTQIEAGF